MQNHIVVHHACRKKATTAHCPSLFTGEACPNHKITSLLLVDNPEIYRNFAFGDYPSNFHIANVQINGVRRLETMDKGQIILYQTPDGDSKIEVRLVSDTVWLSLDQMAELFQRNKSTISRHIKNVLDDGELCETSTIAFFATVQNEGNRQVERKIAFYNLDMIISVGYRVHSYRGVQFRIWATKVLKE